MTARPCWPHWRPDCPQRTRSIVDGALDDRHKQVREAALELLGRLPDSGYARRMVARARECVDLSGTGRIGVTPPQECDRSMRRDGITTRPPTGTGERAWWLEEVLTRTPLSTWPAPAEFFGRGGERGVARPGPPRHGPGGGRTAGRRLGRGTGRRGDRGARGERPPGGPAAAGRAAAGAARRRPGRPGRGRPAPGAGQPGRGRHRADPRAVPATVAGSGRRGGARRAGRAAGQGWWAAGPGRCGHRWPGPGRAEFSSNWRIVGICELAALRLPADLAGRAVGLAQQWRAARPDDPTVPVVERFAATLRYRNDMLEELR